MKSIYLKVNGFSLLLQIAYNKNIGFSRISYK